MAQSTLYSDIKDMPEHPFQPVSFKFPLRSFGKTTVVRRSFQSSWFHRWKWIHYDATVDAAFCFSCCKAASQGKVKLTGLTEGSFTNKGFTNWKDANRIFAKHESSDVHKQSTMCISSNTDIAELLSTQHAREKEQNRNYFLRILSSIRYLARQGLPIRGDGSDKDSNFYQLMLLRGEDVSRIQPMLEKAQNEIYFTRNSK